MLQLHPKGPDLWDSILPEEARALPDDLAHIDELLADERFLGPFARQFDERTGKPGVPVATYLRLMYLRRKHRLSYDALVEAVSTSIAWRRFCGIGVLDRVPDSSTLARLTQKYGETVLHELYAVVSDDLREWTIRRRRAAARRPSRRPAGRESGPLLRRLARLPRIGPAVLRILRRARTALSAESGAHGTPAGRSPEERRRLDRRLLRILRQAAARARGLLKGTRDEDGGQIRLEL